MTRMFQALCLLAIAFAAPASASASGVSQARAEAEASMLVTGTLDIGADGTPGTHRLDQVEKLPPYVVALVERMLPTFRFEPLPGGVTEQAKMSLRLVARSQADGGMQVALRAAHFGEARGADDPSGVRALNIRPPVYPRSALLQGGRGTAYLIVRVGRDGSAEDVAVEKVDLTAIGNARAMAEIRKDLGRAGIEAARRWRFQPPTTGDEVDAPYWVVRVPVSFAIGGDGRAGYGEWQGYHPGPRTMPDWADEHTRRSAPDALVAGIVHTAGTKFRLIDPPSG